MADLVGDGGVEVVRHEGLGDIEAGLSAAFEVAGVRREARTGAVITINLQIVGLRGDIETLNTEGERENAELNRQRDAARREIERRLAWGEVGLEEAFPLIALTADRTPPSAARTAAILETARNLVAIKPGTVMLVDGRNAQDRPQALVASERLMPSGTGWSIACARPGGSSTEVNGLLNPLVKEETVKVDDAAVTRIVPCTRVYAGVEQISRATVAAIDSDPAATPGWVVTLSELGLKLEDVNVDRARIQQVVRAIEAVVVDPLCADRGQVHNAITAAFVRRATAHPDVVADSLRRMIVANLGISLDGDPKSQAYQTAVSALRTKLQVIEARLGHNEFEGSEKRLRAILDSKRPTQAGQQ